MGKKVGLVQDDLDCKEVMRYILEQEGFEVIALDTNQAVTNMPADCDLLIVDEFAEGRTGCEICRIVKDNMKTANRAVILSSTTTGVEHISEMSKADGFLAKPFDINYFIALVKSFCFPDVSALSHSKLINL